VTQDELREHAESSAVTIMMKDSTEYNFLEGNYHIRGDSLRGFGLRRSGGNSDIVLDVSLPFNDFQSLKMDQFNTLHTVLLGSGIAIGAAIIAKMLIYNQNLETAVAPAGPGNP
jgi:hypothetical protein